MLFLICEVLDQHLAGVFCFVRQAACTVPGQQTKFERFSIAIIARYALVFPIAECASSINVNVDDFTAHCLKTRAVGFCAEGTPRFSLVGGNHYQGTAEQSTGSADTTALAEHALRALHVREGAHQTHMSEQGVQLMPL